MDGAVRPPLMPVFSGVIVVEAQKRLYQGLPVFARASRRVFVPVLAPQGDTVDACRPLDKGLIMVVYCLCSYPLPTGLPRHERHPVSTRSP
jgi:hypothetical protein